MTFVDLELFVWKGFSPGNIFEDGMLFVGFDRSLLSSGG